MKNSETVEVLQAAFWQAVEHLLLHHTNPWELDAALTTSGYTMGPCEAQDLLGLDQVLARMPECAGPILRRMVTDGRIGKTGGAGYYRYPGGGGAVIDPLIEDLIREEAWFAKVERVEISDTKLITVMNDALRMALGGNEIKIAILTAAVHFPINQQL